MNKITFTVFMALFCYFYPIFIILYLIIFIAFKFNYKHVLIFLLFIIFLLLNNIIITTKPNLNEITFSTTKDIKNYENYKTDYVNNIFNSYLITFNHDQNINPASFFSCKVKSVNKIENKYNNPSSFDYVNYSLSKKVVYELKLNNCMKLKNNTSLFDKVEILRSDITTYIKNKYENSDLINALFLGQKDLDDTTKDLFSNNSLMHLITISGAHLIVIINVLTKIFFKFKISKNKSNIYITIILLTYLILAGSSIALLRAICLKVGNIIFHNTSSNILMCYITILFLIINPYLVLNIGFILSFGITFIVINYKTNVFKLTLLIQLLTFPLIFNLNYTYNIFSIISILLYTPLITYILLPLSFLATILYFLNTYIPFIDYIFSIFKNILLLTNIKPQIYGHFNDFFISLYYIIFIISFKLKKILILLFLIVLILINNFTYINTVDFIDINQGKSIILKFDNNKTMVIDSGSEKHSKELVSYLRYSNIKQIDYYIITHDHEDHYGGSESLYNNFNVINTYSSYKYKNAMVIKDNFTFNINGFDFNVINPMIKDDNPNNMSLVLYAKLGNKYFLFTGDIEKEIEQKIISKYKLKVDVLDVPHHGSNTSTSKEFINSIRPKYAIMQFGKNNIYKHPSSNTINTLNNYNVNILFTSNNGVIRFYFTKNHTSNYVIIN